MFRKLALSLAILGAIGAQAHAQTVDEIIAKNIQAQGGIEKIKSHKSIRMTGTLDAGGGILLPIILTALQPNHIRIEFTVQGLTGIVAYDGANAWQVIPFTGKKDPEPMDEDGRKELAYESDLTGPLVDYKEKGNKVELVGKEPVEGSDAYKLKVTLKNGDIHYIFLDADSYLQIQESSKSVVRGTEQTTKSTAGDYKEVDGQLFPFSVSTVVEGGSGAPGQDRKIKLDKIEVNVPADPSLFKMPTVKAEAKPEEKKP